MVTKTCERYAAEVRSLGDFGYKTVNIVAHTPTTAIGTSRHEIKSIAPPEPGDLGIVGSPSNLASGATGR